MIKFFLPFMLLCYFVMNAHSQETTTASGYDKAGVSFVHLFEWSWVDVAKECELYLGPSGYYAVQISPPQEHLNNSAWWARYQPVSYKLGSRGGTETEFKDMISRCHKAGVKVYADVVINHMTSTSGKGSAGTTFSKFSYPEYSRSDFHSSCALNDYHNRWQVQNCDLVGLADLKTEAEKVQKTIAAYINKLIEHGIDGIRIDAAKHIPSTDIAAIKQKLKKDIFVFQEVIDYGNEPIKGAEYLGNGMVTEFRYGSDLARIFREGKLSWLQTFGETWGMQKSQDAVVFLDNHDNQRGHGGNVPVLTHKEGRLYALAHVFALAVPYGYPRIMSSYGFNGGDDPPPSVPVHTAAGLNCYKEWMCEHRWKVIVNMMRFRRFTASASTINNWWSNGNNQIAFARGKLGFVVINRENQELKKWFYTGLPEGKYCNVVKGYMQNDRRGCSGEVIYINSHGWTEFKVPAIDAAVIHLGAKLK